MSASSMKWVVSSTVVPMRCLKPRITSQVYRRLLGSMPLVGSSRITTDGLPTNATATESFLRCPPESAPASHSALFVRPTAAILSSTSRVISDSGTPLNTAKSSRCSLAVNVGQSTSNWGQTPRSFRIDRMSVSTLMPSIIAAPPSCLIMPVSTEMVVVFPAPLCPRSAVICPLRAAKQRPSTALFDPKVLTRLLTLSIGAPSSFLSRFTGSTPSGRLAVSWGPEASAAAADDFLPSQYEGSKMNHHGRTRPNGPGTT